MTGVAQLGEASLAHRFVSTTLRAQREEETQQHEDIVKVRLRTRLEKKEESISCEGIEEEKESPEQFLYRVKKKK